MNVAFEGMNPGISPLEMHALWVPETSFLPGNRCGVTVDAIVESLPSISGILTSASCRVLVLTSSAVRAIFHLKALASLRRKCTVGKLFGRHLKVEDQVSLLKRRRVPIAIGTPARVLSILDQEPSLLAATDYIVIDASRDVKLRSIFDIPETSRPLLSTIYKHFIASIQSGRCRMVVFS